MKIKIKHKINENNVALNFHFTASKKVFASYEYEMPSFDR